MNGTTEKDSAPESSSEKTLQQLNLIRYNRAFARRSFIKNIGLAGVGVAAGALVQGCSSGGSVSHAAGPSETDVLNFALNLEYLEGEFYSVATTGSTLSSTISGGASMATGGAKVPFTTAAIEDAANEIAADEALHVQYLRTALGSAAVAEPKINLNALGIGFGSENDFLTLARAFEDTGVSAYGGAATLLSGNNLQAAAQILAVEAYHAGNIRLYLILKENGILTPVAAVPGALDSMDVPPVDAPPNTHFFTTLPSGLAVIRNPSEVLAIVYANAAIGTASGGFFPSGLNGNITTITQM
ncbi:MAG: ferritin-like domain-containing protein [Candidatus Acidiferrales bacterium]